MGRMKSLQRKYLKPFLIYITTIMLCCSPAYYFTMRYFYQEYLDGLVIARSNEFIAKKVPVLTIPEADTWDQFDDNLQILPFDEAYKLDTMQGVFLYKRDVEYYHKYRILYREIKIEGKQYILMCRIPMMGNLKFFKIEGIQYILIFIILLISLIFIQWFVSQKSWASFYDTLKKIENYNLAQGDIPVFEQTDVKEFFRLNEILMNLISNNLQIYQQQKEFIENASHELQTPLAVFQSSLDTVLQIPNLNKKQIIILRSLYSTSSRLTRLSKNLLLLAKIDNNQFKDMEEVDFVDLLHTSLPYFIDQAEAQGIRKSSKIDNQLIIRANRSLLESLINNLMANAILHNTDKGGTIIIEVKDKTFIVSNTGENRALNPDKIFKRFNRTSEEKKGNGLGLSIVYQICKFHKWELKYQFQEGMHSFIVTFR